MQKIFIKRLLLLFSAVAFISYGLLWACAGGDWDEYSYSSFTPEAFVDSAYKPFFYSDQFYYAIGHDNEHVVRFNQEIVEEWGTYLALPNTEKELQYFLLTASEGVIDSINQLPIQSLPKALAGIQLVRNKSDKKIAAFFTFLGYAKANESYAATQFDYWDYDEQSKEKALSAVQKNNLTKMEQEFSSSTDIFIKQRYFFQLIRGYFFDARFNDCISFYEKYQTQFPANTLAARCLSYVAGSFYKQKNYAQANYWYSKIYDISNHFKTVAHFSFHPQNESDWQQTLALCKTKEEQITLWQLLGIYFDEQRSIKEIYALDPKSEKLDLMLARLVNKQELKINTNEYGDPTSKSHTDSFSLSSLELVANVAKAENTIKPYLWYLSAGYLNFLKTDYKKAEEYYGKSEKTLPNTELAKAQLRLFIFMNRLASLQKIDASSEQILLPDLLWLQNDAGHISEFRNYYAYDWAKRTLAEKYEKQNDHLKSELCVQTHSYYSNPLYVAQLKSFLLKERPSKFETYCQEIYPIKVASISEYQAIVLVYQDKIDEAIALMQEAEGVKDALLPGNPFNGNIKDCHDCDHAAAQKVKYSQLAFLLKLKEMKANVAAGRDIYNNALLLGNAFYNITHFGNARFFYEGEVIGLGHSSPDIIPENFRAMLLDCSIAKHYYKTALSAASTQEQKAKLTYLLLKIERNEHYIKLFANPDYSSWNYADMPPTNFSLLRPYQNTQYYKDVLSECGYFRSYLAKHK
jgi:hypothetical protein